jgi:hypothetical protein
MRELYDMLHWVDNFSASSDDLAHFEILLEEKLRELN